MRIARILLIMGMMVNSSWFSEVYGQVPERAFGSKQRESGRLLELAMEKFTAQEYYQALELLNESLQYQTDNIDAYFNRAIVKEQLHDQTGALTDYQIVLLLDSTYREAAFNRAKLRYQMQQYQRAVDDFNKVLKMSSSGTQALYFKGTRLNNEGPVGIQGITTTYSMDADIYNYIGLCFQAMQEHNSALASFAQALEGKPDEVNVLVNRGLSHAAVGNHQRAMADFRSALALDPQHAIARFNLTQEMERSGHLEISTYDELIENNPDFASAYVNRALVKLNSGDTEGALKDYHQALAIDPHDPTLYINRALAWEKAGQYRKALADYNTALELDAMNAKGYRNRGKVLFELGEYQLALEDMDDAIKLDPIHGGAYFNRALIYYKTGNIDQTCRDLEKAIELGVDVANKALEAYCIK